MYSDDGSEFKREFKELMDFWDIEKQVTRGHAYFAERTIRTIKEAMLRRIAAGAGRRGQWHLMLADILSQINGRKHATTQVAPNLAYSDPEMAEIALRNIERRAKHKVTRPEIKVGDMVRIRVKPIESRGSAPATTSAMASPKCCACHDFASPEPRARQHPSPLDSCQMLPLPRKHSV